MYVRYIPWKKYVVPKSSTVCHLIPVEAQPNLK